MKSRNKILLIILLVVTAACDDFIDVVPDNIATIDNAFALRNEAEKYLFTCYSYLPRHGSISYNPAFFGGDELVPAKEFQASGLQAYNLITGRQGVGVVYMSYWNGYNGGSLQRNNADGRGAYAAIRDCNIFLENIGRVPDMEENERQRWIAEVQFLKAYYHFWLAKQYGPIIIADKNLPIDAGIEEVQQYRNTLDETFTYIVEQLDLAINNENLPDRIMNEATELGRITKAIALAVKADVMVTWASPLFNGNTLYAGLKDNRGIEIFNPHKTEEQKRQRWEAARDACKEAIDFAHAQGNRLYYYVAGEYPLLNEQTVAKLNIRMAVTDKWNVEVIWGDANNWVGSQGGNKDLQQSALPRDLDVNKIKNTWPRNNLAVPIKIAEQFYTKHGVPITEDKDWKYEDRLHLRTATTDEKYLIKDGETTCELNFDREIRYYASLGFDRGVWFGQGKTDDNTCYFVKARFGENCANSVNTSWNMTGIWPKKMVHFKTELGTDNYTPIKYPFPIIRLASLYLWYAEALNESGETDVNKIFEYVDKVRERASLEGVVKSWQTYSTNSTKISTIEGRREIIQQERLIEFAFEGQRYWDMRRWLRAHTEFPKPLTGWTLTASEPIEYYNERIVSNPQFRIRDYFTPLGETELKRNINLKQNYGWEE